MFFIDNDSFLHCLVKISKMRQTNIKKLFKFLSKILFTLSARSTCLFMPFFACFSLFRSYIARYTPLKKEKNILKKFYKNFKDINLNNF